MGKKRPFLVEKRAQITIFMILGLSLFFIFLFLMQAALKTEEIKLSAEQEKVLTKVFKKESLRLFVDDCLQDELEKGLILLGKQGTVWADQPGGIKLFSEGINGVTITTDGEPHRIAYALTAEHYLQFPSAFPCEGEENPPGFCLYQYPNTNLKFGNRKLFSSTFTQDLQQYLLDRTAWCVQNFILSDVSAHAEIVATEIELGVTIMDEGISAKIDYPLKFKVGGEEIFSLSTFDFFYPSHFNQLLETVTLPLRWEQELVDFNYTEETFVKPTFSYGSEQNVGPCVPERNYFQCERALALDTYQSLGVDMNTESLPNGDDIFTFTPALYEIVNNPDPYSLQIARQNRPPALDYIQRDACPAERYDYLVIKNYPARDDINLIPHALDPDEDDFSISFSPELGAPAGETIHRPAEDVAAFPNGFYTITATATDEHGKADSQDVRILVDRPIRVDLSLAFPEKYGVNSYIGGGGDTIPLYVVSREDPILLQATIPAGTETANLQTIILNYVDGSTDADLGRDIGRLEYGDDDISTEQCYNLPLREGDESTCVPGEEYDLNSYYNTEERVRRLIDFNYYTFHPFQRITDPAAPGTLSLNFNTKYCDVALEEEREEINVLVQECVPVKNPEHPFAYPYEKYKFGLQEDGRTDFLNYLGNTEEINPLEATHSCCLGDPALTSGWRIKTAEEGDCFVNPAEGCYGRISGLTTGNNKGYLLEQEFAVCDGTRGNICGSRQGKLYQDKLRCGTPSENPECRADIAAACRGELSFGLVETENGDKGWCNDRMGCANFCQTALVYTLGEESYFAADDINRIAQNNQITTNPEMADFGFKCGCTSIDEGKRCDQGFDGRFTGVCENGQCNDVICTPGAMQCEPDTIRNVRQCNSAGTEWVLTQTCAAEEYCSEGECEPQKCEPNALVCYDGFLGWVGREYPDSVDEVEADTQENPERERHPFFCTEEGSGYREIRAECSPGCTAEVTVVEVNAEREEWRCRVCRQADIGGRQSDGTNIPAKRCLKNGVRGECDFRVINGNEIRGEYDCRRQS